MYWFFVTLALLRLVPAALGALRWKALPVYMQLFVVLLWVGVIQTVIKVWFGVVYGNNLALSHGYAALELLIIGLAYAYFYDTKRSFSFFKFCVIPVSVIILFYGYLWLDSPGTFLRLSKSGEGILIMAMALAWLLNYKGRAVREGFFWISGGLLLFFACNLNYFLFTQVLFEIDRSQLLVLQITVEVINLISNALFTIGIWKHTLQRSYSVL